MLSDMEKGADAQTLYALIFENCGKRLMEMSSVIENNKIIPAIHKVSNHLVSVTDNILL